MRRKSAHAGKRWIVARRRLAELETEGGIPREILDALRLRHEYRAGHLPANSERNVERLTVTADLRTALIGVEREFIYCLLRDGQINRRVAPAHRTRTRPEGSQHRLPRRKVGLTCLSKLVDQGTHHSNKDPLFRNLPRWVNCAGSFGKIDEPVYPPTAERIVATAKNVDLEVTNFITGVFDL